MCEAENMKKAFSALDISAFNFQSPDWLFFFFLEVILNIEEIDWAWQINKEQPEEAKWFSFLKKCSFAGIQASYRAFFL